MEIKSNLDKKAVRLNPAGVDSCLIELNVQEHQGLLHTLEFSRPLSRGRQLPGEL